MFGLARASFTSTTPSNRSNDGCGVRFESLECRQLMSAPVEGLPWTYEVSFGGARRPDSRASDFEVEIHWGDGSVTKTRNIRPSDPANPTGPYIATETHTYLHDGNHTTSDEVIVYDLTRGGSRVQTHVPGPVGDAPLTARPVLIHASAQTEFNGTVATFTDANPLAKASDFRASINWGHGVITDGTVTAAGGGFAVSGKHQFRSGDDGFTISVSIFDSHLNVGTKSPVTVSTGTDTFDAGSETPVKPPEPWWAHIVDQPAGASELKRPAKKPKAPAKAPKKAPTTTRKLQPRVPRFDRRGDPLHASIKQLLAGPNALSWTEWYAQFHAEYERITPKVGNNYHGRFAPVITMEIYFDKSGSTYPRVLKTSGDDKFDKIILDAITEYKPSPAMAFPAGSSVESVTVEARFGVGLKNNNPHVHVYEL